MLSTFSKPILPIITTSFLAGFLVAFAPVPSVSAAPNQLTEKEKKEGWTLLFDGKSMEHFRNFKKDKVSSGWQVKDGAIVWTRRGAGDLITREQYDKFEMVLEYRISKAGNSGIMFHVTEDASSPWRTGPEIQIQDNVDGYDPQKSGWLYQLYKAKTDATKPVGQWNEVRIRLHPDKSTVWMNGVKYYDFVKGNQEWDALVAKSKFARMKQFGKPNKGHICLQDHGNEIAFRNIKVRKLD